MSKLDNFINDFKSGLKKLYKPKSKPKSKPKKQKSSHEIVDNSPKIKDIFFFNKGTPCITFLYQGKHTQHGISCVLHYLGEDNVSVVVNTQDMSTGIGTQFGTRINLKQTSTVNKLIDKVKKDLSEDSFY